MVLVILLELVVVPVEIAVLVVVPVEIAVLIVVPVENCKWEVVVVVLVLVLGSSQSFRNIDLRVLRFLLFALPLFPIALVISLVPFWEAFAFTCCAKKVTSNIRGDFAQLFVQENLVQCETTQSGTNMIRICSTI